MPRFADVPASPTPDPDKIRLPDRLARAAGQAHPVSGDDAAVLGIDGEPARVRRPVTLDHHEADRVGAGRRAHLAAGGDDGLLGVLLAGLWFARTRGVPFLAVGDLLCALAPAGLLFGRLANFVNAELVGRATTVPWAVVFPREGTEPRHPSQLYEALGEGLLPLLWMLWRYPKRLPAGQVAGEFPLLYSAARFISG